MRTVFTKHLVFGVCAALLLIPITLISSYSLNSNKEASKESLQPNSNVAPADNNKIRPTKTTWNFHDEQEWIVDSIGRDIAEMLIFAKYHSDPKITFSADGINFKTTCVDKNANRYRYNFVLPNAEHTRIEYEFALKDYAWGPAGYKPFANYLMTTMELKPVTPTKAPDIFLKCMANANSKEIFEQNETLSKALSATPLDASLHEQAALIQATIDMLECAGYMSDTRAPLNRMAAHLAIAQALNEGDYSSTNGKLAEVALESMSCRDAVSIKENDALAKTTTEAIVQSFLRALKIRTSGDYRLFDEAHQTPIEASQYGIRYAGYLTADKVLNYVAKHNCQPALRWRRIALLGRSSVQSGHEIKTEILQQEIADLRNDYELYNKQSLPQSAMVSELNKTPTRCLSSKDGKSDLVVLSWDDLAAYHARHIIFAANEEFTFANNDLYAVDLGASIEQRNEKMLSGVSLFPLTLVNANMKLHPDIRAEYFGGIQLLIDLHPELLTCDDWYAAELVAQNYQLDNKITPPETWFSPAFPMGTAYYFGHRRRLKNSNLDLAELTRLREICPFDESLCRLWTEKKYGAYPTSAQLREGYGALVEYAVPAMRRAAGGDYLTPDIYIPKMEKVAKIDASYYYTLAEYCALHNLDDKAAKYFQLALDQNEDDVQKANESHWYVDYLFDHGQKDKALSIAKEAADTYSAMGLTCLALLYERMGKWPQAEDLFIKERDRYDKYSQPELTAFYLRNAGRDPKFAKMANQFSKPIFPNGLERFETSKLVGPPKTGMLITKPQLFPESQGLKKDFILIGINGCRVNNFEQSSILREMAMNPKFKLTVWDGKKYKDILLNTVNDNRLMMDMVEFPSLKKPEW